MGGFCADKTSKNLFIPEYSNFVLNPSNICVCVCVCVRERERENVCGRSPKSSWSKLASKKRRDDENFTQHSEEMQGTTVCVALSLSFMLALESRCLLANFGK